MNDAIFFLRTFFMDFGILNQVFNGDVFLGHLTFTGRTQSSLPFHNFQQ